MTPTGLYIHIPFCRSRCSYCDFATGIYQGELAARYVRALVEEISTSRHAGAPVDTVYFGGGTPSLLTPSQLHLILLALHRQFDIDSGAEVTLEMNPGTVSRDIEDSLPTLREFYRLGVRYMTLTWNNTNSWADAGRGEKKYNGLNEFGQEVVREMNRLGMLVDVSHVSDDTMSDVLDISKAPIIASHSSARALSDQPRNIPDDLLRRIAKNGGVVHVNFYSAFVDTNTVTPQSRARDERLKAQQDAIDAKYKDDPERRAEESDKLEQANPLPPLPISKLIDHFDHIVKVAGIDHVGIGADFDGANDMPEGAKDVSMLPNITYELVKRGYSERDIRKVLGENLLRAMAEAERISRSMSRSISGDGSTRKIK